MAGTASRISTSLSPFSSPDTTIAYPTSSPDLRTQMKLPHHPFHHTHIFPGKPSLCPM
jgi:hypothetical protein